MNQKKVSEFVLCYISGNFAYFTEVDLKQQWGDDWNDAPYEHNASEPYSSHKVNEKYLDHKIVKVAWDGSFDAPNTNYTNSPFSVEQINNKMHPWLRTWASRSGASIFAGATLAEFIKFIEDNEGAVYLPRGTELPT